MYVFNPQICVSYNLRKLYYEVYRYVFNPQICVSYNMPVLAFFHK